MGYPATMKSLVGNGEMELIAHAVEQKLATLTESPSSNSIDPQRFYGNVYERAVLLLKYQQQFASNWIQVCVRIELAPC
jgi:hypothetical protein